jgi:23S rRNA (adenine2503-C2)-methyltransferase
MAELKQILNFDRDELTVELTNSLGVKPFRAKQIVQWLYRRRVKDFSEMTDINKELREKLSSSYEIYRPEIDTVQLSKDGTRKYLMRLKDGKLVETVLICQPKRYTLCISSQVGCAIGCKFCRTGLMGLTRHLETHEILGQVLRVQDHIDELQLNPPPGETVPEQFLNIVFMGMGEPLHNFDNVIRAAKLLNDGLGSNFSKRKVTISTSGLVPQIRELGKLNIPVALAISLNSTTNECRDNLIPINKRYPLDELLKTLREFPLNGRMRITLEYVMLHGVNDTLADLERLPRIIRGIPAKINLIPYNENAGLGFKGPPEEWVHRWQKTLLDQGLNATVRWSKGQDIGAACGQLATESSRKAVKSDLTRQSVAEEMGAAVQS